MDYRTGIHSRYFHTYAAAAALSRDFASDSRAGVWDSPHLRSQRDELARRVDSLLEVLPPEVKPAAGDLRRHLAWMDHWLMKNAPQDCWGDVIDILERDLPKVLQAFDEWIMARASHDRDFEARVQPLMLAGRFDSALRDGWAYFKTGLVSLFDLPTSLDGSELAKAVFGDHGVLRGILPDDERVGYWDLVRALYGLNRNLVQHNLVDIDIREAEIVLALQSLILGRAPAWATQCAARQAS